MCLVFVHIGCAAQHQVSFEGYGGTAIVADGGRTLIVGPYGLVCGDTVTVVARESRARVGLFLKYVSGVYACQPGEGAMGLVPAQRIRLRAPLSHRKLVDGRNGVATPWLSARFILRPRLTPAGYRSTGLRPWISSSLYQGSGRSAGCMQIYQLQNRPREFEIIQSPAGLWLRHRGDWRRILVRGHRGRAAPGMITWREHGLTNVISAYGGLSVAQLLAIANSAPA